MSEKNGKPRKPRTPSHQAPERPPERPAREPSAAGPENLSGGGDDRPTGLLGALDEPTVRPVSNGRAAGGRFAPQNGFGKGNPHARRAHELRMQFLDAVHPETIPALAKKLQVQALSGDLDAMKLLLDYTLGKPAQAVALTDADGGPLGFNFHQVTAIVLDALAGDPAKRIEVAAKLMELDDARDADA